MKRFIFFLIVLVSLPIFSQTCSFLWERMFVYGSGNSTDTPQALAIDKNNNIFASGSHITFKELFVQSAFKSFSDNGDEMSVFVDTISVWTNSNFNQITALENESVVFSSSYSDGTKTNLICVDKNNTELWRKEIQGFPGIGSIGDTIVVVTQGKQNVFFYGPGGNLIRSFSLGDVRGNITVRIHNDEIVVIALYYEGSILSAFVRVSDRYSGQEIWRKNFLNNIRTFGDVDKDGNIYVGLSESQGQLLRLRLIKCDNNGNEIWRKEWYPRSEGGESNMANFVNSVAVSWKSGQVVLAAEIQRDSANTGRVMSYVKSFSIINGDSLWEKRWLYDTNAIISHVTALKFNNTGNLLILGNTYTNPNGNPPNICYLSKYSFGVTGIENISVAPTTYSLSQNYPNPFNPSTKIQFSVTKEAFVTLKVYDMLGREVETLVNGEKSSGAYEVSFDASKLSSGVYFYTINAKDFNKVKKMILLR